ncbi:MAG: glycosyltransferase family 9 protein, partial [Candidatus Omnitrophica bacterium]|nr:glycosyltransferase family 9 protein [Candidatus Omnitrophota bacterium]
LAMLTPIKKFVFFGPETPKVFGQNRENTRIFYSQWLCSPCLSVLNHRVSVCRDNLCLKNISVEDVYNAIMQDCGIPVPLA